MNLDELQAIALKARKLFELGNNGGASFGGLFVAIAGDKLIRFETPDFVSHGMKTEFKQMCCLLLKAYSADACIFIYEAWTLPQNVISLMDKAELERVMEEGIDDHPAREEVLSVYLETPSSKAIGRVGIARDGNGGLFSFEDTEPLVAIKEGSTSCGRFTDFFPMAQSATVPERVLNEFRTLFNKDILTLDQLDAKCRRSTN